MPAMNDTIKEIVRILHSGSTELQVAAIQILGELKPQDTAVTSALEEVLRQGDVRILGRYILQALKSIGSADAVRVLVGRLRDGDTISDQSAQILAEMGEVAHKPLADLFEGAGEELESRILDIFGRSVSKDAVRVLQKAILVPESAARAAEALVHGMEGLTAAQSKALKTNLTKKISGKTLEVEEECVPHILAVIAALDGPGARPTLLKFAGDRYPVDIRRAALQALAATPLTPTQIKQILAMLTEASSKSLQSEIAVVLDNVESWPDGTLPTLKKLVASKSPSLKIIAIRALRTSHTTEVAKIAMKYLHHQDAGFREAAELVLSQNPKAVDLLVRSMATEKDPQRLRTVAGLLVCHRDHFPKKTLTALVEKAAKLLTNGEGSADVHCDLVFALDGELAAELLVDKALRQRRARRLPDCLALLARVAQTDFMTDEGRYQLAVAKLLAAPRGPEEGAPGDPTMGYIGALVRSRFPVLDRIVKESMLESSTLLRVATHFAEAVGNERRFGVDLLQHLADRKSDRTGEQARMVLRAEGL